MIRLLITFFLFVVHLQALNIISLDTEMQTGKTALVKLGEQQGVVYKDVTLGKKKYPVFPSPRGGYFALIPIQYTAKPRSLQLTIHYVKDGKNLSERFYFDIIKGSYESEEVKVDGKKVNPRSKKVRKRIAKEYNEAMKIYNHMTPQLYFTTAFILPVSGIITSDFGKERLYNGVHKSFHGGTDFRAKVGAPVKASNDGIVVLVKKRFYSGGTVVIDHGGGIYTCYFHLSKFRVKKGDLVHKGHTIALSGKSGRVTGPHLHFAVRVHGVQVDPMQFVTVMNQKLLKD